MKFTINKDAFTSDIQIAQRAMANKTNLPALTGMLMTASEGVLVLTTSNMDISIKVKVNNPSLNIESDGECLVPGRLFFDIVRKLGGETVCVELEQDNILRIVSGSSDVNLNLLDVADYPKIRFDLSEHPIVMKVFDLKEIIRETTFAASVVDNKPILTGVNFRIYDNKLLAVSTDSFRLSRRNMLLDEEYPETNIIVPARSLNELAKIFKDDSEKVELYLDKNKVMFVFENVMFQSRLLEGNYPDTSKLIPSSYPIILKFDKTSLLETIDRVSTLSSNPNTTPVVKLQTKEDKTISITSSSPELGTIVDTITPLETVSIEDIKISFSATFFIDALKAFSSGEVYVKFTGEIKPFILEAENDEGLLELVLPLKTD